MYYVKIKHFLLPDFITGLLNNIGTHVDPIILIRRIRTGMEIPELRDSLVKILQDYNLQVNHLLSLLLTTFFVWIEGLLVKCEFTAFLCSFKQETLSSLLSIDLSQELMRE